jgi:hypothetical protein
MLYQKDEPAYPFTDSRILRHKRRRAIVEERGSRPNGAARPDAAMIEEVLRCRRLACTYPTEEIVHRSVAERPLEAVKIRGLPDSKGIDHVSLAAMSTGFVQNVAVISSMQITPVLVSDELFFWPPVPSGCCTDCAATGDAPKSSAAINASFFKMLPLILTSA